MNTGKVLLSIAFVATALAGCGKAINDGASTDVLVANVPLRVSAGTCAAVEGPYALPSGASTDFTITDYDNSDYIDAGVIDSAYGCNFNLGYGVVFDANTVRSGDDRLPSGYYDFVVRCNNSFYPCQFSLDWTATY